MMKNRFLVFGLLVVVFFSCNRDKSNDRPVVLNQYDYEVTVSSDRISKIVKYYKGNKIDQENVAKYNDTTMLSVLSDYSGTILQKKYYYLNTTGIAQKSIDSVKNEKITGTYFYNYSPEGYLTSQTIDANRYSDDFITVSSHITGNSENTIEGNNIVKTVINRTIESTSDYTEREEYYFYFLENENKDGIQFFSQKYLGIPNQNLVDSIRYVSYKNDVKIESGLYTYSYIINENTKQLVQESELYTSDNTSLQRVKTVRNYYYIAE